MIVIKKNYKYPWFKPFVDKSIKSKIGKIFDKNLNTMGLKTKELENKLKKYLNVKHVILTTSGTSALFMASMVYDLKPGDVIITQNLTWIATINPFLIRNCKIVLADTIHKQENVNYDSLNKLIKKHKPKIVILVHMNGQAVYNKNFNKLRAKMNFKVIEDTAQSFGIKGDKKNFAGTNYDIGCFSFSISKLINMVYGGFCVTNNNKLARKLIAIRNNGVNSNPENALLELPTEIGLNLKPSDLHSCFGIENFKNKHKIFNNAKKIYKKYEQKLKNPKLELVKINLKNSIPVYVQVLVKNKKKFYNFCNKHSIQIHFGTRTLDNVIKKFRKEMLNNSIYLSKYLVRLPCGPNYSLYDLENIIKILNRY